MIDPHARTVNTFQRLSKAAGAVTLLAGVLVLLGWWLNVPIFKSLIPGLTTMKPNTALAFSAAGLALLLMHSGPGDRRLAFLKRASMLLVLLIGLLTLSQYAFGWNLGIDQLIFKEDPGAGGLYPGRMAFVTAANFSLLAVALLLLAARRGRPVGVLMADIDHFKPVNDLFDHAAGHTVLRWLGRYLADSTRGGDIACRYGGEEFVLILPDASLQQTCLRAEQLRQGIAALAMRHGEQALPTISVSIGVAAYPEHGATSEALLRTADAGLYRAKREGRNRVAAG